MPQIDLATARRFRLALCVSQFMRKVSASPSYLRNVFPIFWFGAFMFLSMNVFGDPTLSNDGGYALIAIAIVGCVVSRMLAFKLMDEVYDEGDSLLVRRKEHEQRIYLHQVNKVSTNNAWINLKTTSEGEIGNKVSFVLTPRLFHFTNHPYFVELKERIESASNT